MTCSHTLVLIELRLHILQRLNSSKQTGCSVVRFGIFGDFCGGWAFCHCMATCALLLVEQAEGQSHSHAIVCPNPHGDLHHQAPRTMAKRLQRKVPQSVTLCQANCSRTPTILLALVTVASDYCYINKPSCVLYLCTVD